jgi:hypothetical protein
MATFYLDNEGGNDANAGTSFALRWKTFPLGATAARIAPGDTVRVMASPDPTSLGINAAWTDLSETVTLASSLNTLITNCDTAWTASANVTSTADTSVYRTSTGSASNAIAGAFTTGLAAYFDLGSSQNYSAFQGITLWVHANAAIAASTLSIRLCSDAVGAVSVDTLAIPAMPGNSQWQPIHIDKGSALGSSIRSIALYADIDPGSITVKFDNISTVKANGANSLSLRSLIGKNTAGEYWWPIRSINGTTVILDDAVNMTAGNTTKGYVGTTATTTTYKREAILPPGGTPENHLVMDSGTSGSPITFSCGWNRTDMSTQTGQSYFDGCNGNQNGFNFNGQTFISVDRWFGVRWSTAMVTSASDGTIGTCGAMASSVTGLNISGGPNRVTVTEFSNIGSNSVGISINCNALVATTLVSYNCNSNGMTLEGRGMSIDTLRAEQSSSTAILVSGTNINNMSLGTVEASNSVTGLSFSINVMDLRIKALTCASNSSIGLNPSCGINNRIDVATLTSNGTAIALNATTFVNGALVIGSLTTSGNTTVISTGVLQGILYINTSSFAEATPITFSGTGYSSGRIVVQNYDGVAGDHRTFYSNGTAGATVVADATTRHTSSGLSWKFTSQSATFVSQNFPIAFPVARVALTANLFTTIRLYTRRAATTVTGTLRCRGGQLAGVPSDLTASSSAAIDTWEALTLTFTPTETGVMEFDFLMYGAASVNLFIHDFSAGQI